MQLKTILNRVEKCKSFVYGSVELIDEDGQLELLVQINARKGNHPICSGCHRRGPQYDRMRALRFQFVPLRGIAVHFV